MLLDEVPATPSWSILSSKDGTTLYYAGSAIIDLFSSDTANYRDNLMDGEPRVWPNSIALQTRRGALLVKVAGK